MSEVKRYELVEMGITYHKAAEMLLAEDGLWVDYDDYAELKAQRDALAADNAALISAFSPKEISTEATDNLDATAILKIDGDEFHSWQWIDNQDDVIRGVLDFFKPNTPATAEYLKSLRAEGVDDLATFAGEQYQQHAGDKSQQKKWKSVAFLCTQFAAQLRAGKDGE